MNSTAILNLISELYEAVSALNAENSALKIEVASLRNALGAADTAEVSPSVETKAGDGAG